MKKHKGSMIAYLNKVTQDAVRPMDGYVVQQIDVEKIIPNKKNFYSITGIEEMANSLAVSDNMPPLDVVDNGDGTYRLISGERRLSATLYRMQRGEMEYAELPCHVLPEFQATGALTAEQTETLAIIMANNYRQKSPLDQLNEIKELEPIAKAIYQEAKERGDLQEDGGKAVKFRTFFARQILDVSPTSLQRLQALANLSQEAKAAFEEGLIGKTVASELAALQEDEQDAFIQKVRDGKCSGSYSDVKEWLGQLKGETEDLSLPLWNEDSAARASDRVADNEESETKTISTIRETAAEDEPPYVTESFESNTSNGNEDVTEDKAENDMDDSAAIESMSQASEHLEEKAPAAAAPALSSLSVGQAEQEANRWVAERLQALVEEVEAKIRAAEEMHESVDAARWEVRRSAIRLIIETIS